MGGEEAALRRRRERLDACKLAVRVTVEQPEVPVIREDLRGAAQVHEVEGRAVAGEDAVLHAQRRAGRGLQEARERRGDGVGRHRDALERDGGVGPGRE